MTVANNQILSLGEVLWDHLPEGPRFGGAAANFACHAALLGANVSLVSAVGDDPQGSEAIEILQACGVDTRLVQRIAEAPTGAVGVELDRAGKPTFTIHAGSAWDRIGWTLELERAVANADAVYFGTLSQRSGMSRATILAALEVAKKRGIRRVLDVNLRKPFYDAGVIRESVALASVLKLSDDELEEIAFACGITPEAHPEATLRALFKRHSFDLVAMTRGAEGALLLSATETVDQPGIPAIVRDTVGAGDSFTAALLLGLLQGESLKTVARVACETAAAVCTQHGAVPELRTSLVSR
ncbi:MAG: carbohydrate kinase [Verrucomicrobiota bacterium]